MEDGGLRVVSTRKDAKGKVECVEQSTSRIVQCAEMQGGMAGKVI